MKTLTLEAKIDNIPVITDFINEQLEALDCAMKAQLQIDVAIDEVFTNIASYAYPDGEGMATVRMDFDPATRLSTITFEDTGIPFDPLQQQEPDVTLSAEERPIGGLGIFLVRETMDDVTYERRDGRNILTISKKI